jgi:alpha-galactosidase
MQTIHSWIEGVTSCGAIKPIAKIECLKQGWGKLQAGKSISHLDAKLCLKGQTFENGFGTHADSEILVKLNAPGKRFTALAGIDDNSMTRTKQNKMIFSIEIDNREIWKSSSVGVADEPTQVDVDLNGAGEFILKIREVNNDLNYAHVNWVEPKVTMADGTILTLGVLGAKGILPAPPISFCYGDRKAGEVLAGCEKTCEKFTDNNGVTLHRVVYRHVKNGLEFRLELKEFKDFPAAEWVWKIKNVGVKDTEIFSEIQPMDLSCVVSQPPILHHSIGAECRNDDFIYKKDVLTESKYRLTSTGGRSSFGNLPFFNLEYGQEGFIMAIGWTGQWAAEFNYNGMDLNVQAGMEKTHLKLHPGEEIRTPSMLLITWKGDPIRGNNLLRQFVLQHHTHRPDGKTVPAPICFGSWGGMKSPAHMDRIKLCKDEKLGYEYYWIDAGWYGPADSYSPDEFKGDWGIHVGNWNVNPVAHPNGLRPLSDEIHKAGMKFLLWFEPERAIYGTPLTIEHPEWFLGKKQKGENVIFNLGLPEARAWMTDFISKIISENNIDCYRQDFNIDPLSYWQAADEPDRQGMTEIRHIEGLYAFWDGLLANHPGLIIDNCASGGRRIDLETTGRSIPLWRSDTQCWPNFDPIAGQVHTYGLAHWVPCSTTGSQLHPGDTYNFRSAMCTGMVFHLFGYEYLPIDPKYPYDWHRKMVCDLRRAIPSYLGDYYPLTACTMSKDDWMAYQMHRSDLNEGIVVAFRRENSPFISASFKLRGLNENIEYQFEDADSGQTWSATGAMLQNEGLLITIEKLRESRLIFYRKK